MINGIIQAGAIIGYALGGALAKIGTTPVTMQQVVATAGKVVVVTGKVAAGIAGAIGLGALGLWH